MRNPVLRHIKRFVKAYTWYYDDPIYRRWYLKYALKLERFKNLHKDKDCFIIGNGPSLKSMDLSPIKNYYSFGLNKIYLLFDKVDLNLDYLVATNKYVIEQSSKEFKRLLIPIFLPYKKALNAKKNTNYINYIYTGGSYTFHKDIMHKISEGYTVTFVAMQIAYFMGFKRVFLIGVDHNFKAKGKVNDKQIMIGDDENHFDPNYFKNHFWQLPDLEASELSYHHARFQYNRVGRQIFDATVNGKLSIFPKISYEKALDVVQPQ